MSTQNVKLGEISGLFGVQGSVKVFSFTEPRENILLYSPWTITKEGKSQEVEILHGKRQGKSIIARLKGITDREMAAALIGYKIEINQDLLPKTSEGEYYWRDLIGLKVETLEGVDLGLVDSMLETGANDVVIVKGDKERLIPFLQPETIVNIDLDAGLMKVDWDPEF